MWPELFNTKIYSTKMANTTFLARDFGVNSMSLPMYVAALDSILDGFREFERKWVV